MSAQLYHDDDLMPEVVRVDRQNITLAKRVEALEQLVARLTKKIAYLEGAHTV